MLSNGAIAQSMLAISLFFGDRQIDIMPEDLLVES
jgi:hypothetical protein